MFLIMQGAWHCWSWMSLYSIALGTFLQGPGEEVGDRLTSSRAHSNCWAQSSGKTEGVIAWECAFMYKQLSTVQICSNVHFVQCCKCALPIKIRDVSDLADIKGISIHGVQYIRLGEGLFSSCGICTVSSKASQQLYPASTY